MMGLMIREGREELKIIIKRETKSWMTFLANTGLIYNFPFLLFIEHTEDVTKLPTITIKNHIMSIWDRFFQRIE